MIIANIERSFSARQWGQFLRAEAKYVRAVENYGRLDSFGQSPLGFYSRRMNARQRRRFQHWDHVADRMAAKAAKMDRV